MSVIDPMDEFIDSMKENASDVYDTAVALNADIKFNLGGCRLCGASVGKNREELHRKWHLNLTLAIHYLGSTLHAVAIEITGLGDELADAIDEAVSAEATSARDQPQGEPT